MSTPAKFIEGAIYALHTGYAMQETRFYQVIGFTKSGKSAIVRQLERFQGPKPGFVVTYKDSFSGPARTIRICRGIDGSENIRVGYQDYLWATRPWNGEAGSRDYSINFEAARRAPEAQ
jgi:hypothetical protein